MHLLIFLFEAARGKVRQIHQGLGCAGPSRTSCGALVGPRCPTTDGGRETRLQVVWPFFIGQAQTPRVATTPLLLQKAERLSQAVSHERSGWYATQL